MSKIKYDAVINNEGIRLNGNENGFNPFRDRINEISELRNIELNRYPDDSNNKLRQRYADYCGVTSDNIIAGNGSDEMISLIISKYIGNNKNLITLAPDFSMYDFYVSVNEGNIYKYKFTLNEFNTTEFIEFIKSKNGHLVIFSNPNNPTGTIVPKNDIERILIEFKDIKIVVDEAYYEFYGETVVDLIDKYPNLIVTRTLSKAWGMAALRVGFLIANKELIKDLVINKVPYNINTLSSEISGQLLKYKEEMWISLEKIINQREFLYTELKEIEKDFSDIKFYESKGNFIYARGTGTKLIAGKLNDNGILIRVFKDDSIRITVGNEDENKRLIEVLKD